MSLMRRAKLYLGLGADEDYDEYGQRQPMPQMGVDPGPAPQAPQAQESTGSVRTLPSDGPALRPVGQPGPPPAQAPAQVAPNSAPPAQRPAGSVVRTVAAPVRTEPTVIIPRSFDDAKEIGDTFKNRQPVIVNLQDLPPELGFRLVDFAAGLIFALDGQIKKVTTNVFLLTPANVEVDDSGGMGQGDVWE